jgi:hypothetical protein
MLIGIDSLWLVISIGLDNEPVIGVDISKAVRRGLRMDCLAPTLLCHLSDGQIQSRRCYHVLFLARTCFDSLGVEEGE